MAVLFIRDRQKVGLVIKILFRCGRSKDSERREPKQTEQEVFVSAYVGLSSPFFEKTGKSGGGKDACLCAWRDALILWAKSRRIFFIIIFTTSNHN